MKEVKEFEVNYGTESDYTLEDMMRDAGFEDGDDVRVVVKEEVVAIGPGYGVGE